MTKTRCYTCKKEWSDVGLRVKDKYFHRHCFKCRQCGNSLADGGFFSKDGAFYCTADYQRNFGTKCATCQKYVEGDLEGEVVTVLEKTYHQRCLTCTRCHQPFRSGEEATCIGKQIICQKCYDVLAPCKTRRCAGCGKKFAEVQALVALGQHWHTWCFKCTTCGVALLGDYIERDGKPYCEKDYQKHFGVKCAHCNIFISGNALQAGKNHFHWTCARCTKCGDLFIDREDIYTQGSAIWHPRCGPKPTSNDEIFHSTGITDTDGNEFDWMSSSGASELLFSTRSNTLSSSYSTTSSPRKSCASSSSSYFIMRKQDKSAEHIPKTHQYSYLTEEPTQGYLRKPIKPDDKAPAFSHFHVPLSQSSLSHKPRTRTAMEVLVDSIRSRKPKPKSRNHEELIKQAHFPDAKSPKPAPPPCPKPKRKVKWSDSFECILSDSSYEDEVFSEKTEDAKLKRKESALFKMANEIGKVFLKKVPNRKNLRRWRTITLHPNDLPKTPPDEESKSDNLIASPSMRYDCLKPVSNEYGDMLDETCSSGFKSDYSGGSITDVDVHASNSKIRDSTTYASGLYYPRRTSKVEMPSARSVSTSESTKFHPYHLLVVKNKRLPADVDRLNLEKHLSDPEFKAVFQMSRSDFYELRQWKRNELKRRVMLF